MSITQQSRWVQHGEHVRKVVNDCITEGRFLGLAKVDGPADVTIAPIPYELTTSYGQGTADGPAACIEASTQVELYDDLLGDELPANGIINTAEPWDGEGGDLHSQLDGIAKYAAEIYATGGFPIFLGGEHGILPPIIRASPQKVTIVQIDAHADLRSSLGGEPYSHACAAARAIDEGAIALYQVGIRAYCKEELERIEGDERINTWFAREVMSPSGGEEKWRTWLAAISSIQGPVHLTIDIDGLDGSIVPATGTPVPGGLSFWHAIETIDTLFANCDVISADVNEIVAQEDSPLTQFTAAMLTARIAAARIHTLR
ncbi:MAG: arginase family protein [Candidatus Poseidoniales archaeon]|jgi:agmatinase